MAPPAERRHGARGRRRSPSNTGFRPASSPATPPPYLPTPAPAAVPAPAAPLCAQPVPALPPGPVLAPPRPPAVPAPTPAGPAVRPPAGSPAPPPPQRRGGRPLRVRRGLVHAGVSVTAIVLLELLAAALAATKVLPTAAGVGLVAASVLVLLLGLVPVQGLPLGAWLLNGVGYLSRRHGVTATAQRMGEGTDDADPDAIPVPPDVLAFFPGLSAHRFRTRTGDDLGLLHWRGRWSATLAVQAPASGVLVLHGEVPVPLHHLLGALTGDGVDFDAVQIISQSLFGDAERFRGGLLEQSASELAGVSSMTRGRQMWITVRIDAGRQRDAIAARGGGVAGVGRLAGGVLARITAQLRADGLSTELLAPAAAVRALSDALLEPPAGEPGPTRWVETWNLISSSRIRHRSFVASRLDSSLDAVSAVGGFGVTVCHEVTRSRRAPGQLRVCAMVRLSTLGDGQLDTMARRLRLRCRAVGIGLRLLAGQQLDGVRSTVPGGCRER